jgi:integrase
MRKRKSNRHLPQCVYQKHGAYYYVKGGKWERLGSDLPTALQEYARIKTHGKGLSIIVDRVISDAEKRVKPNTLAQYRQAAATIKAAFVEFSPEKVNPQHVFQFMDHHKSTPNMANRMRSVLKMAFDYAVRSGECQSNPAVSVPRFKEAKRDRYITDKEYMGIYNAGSPTLRSIMDMAYLTAQRIGDILSIRLSDITADGVLFRQEKTGKRLMVRSTPELSEAVSRAKALHGRKITPTYLLGQRNGKVRKYSGVKGLFQRAALKAGVVDVTLHDIRAKSITDAKRQGLDPQALAGHTTEAQTVRYIRDRETAVVSGPSFRQP